MAHKTIFAPKAPSYPITSNTMGYWRLDGNSTDSTGKNKTGITDSNCIYSTNYAILGQGLLLNNTTGSTSTYITITGATVGVTTATLSMWINVQKNYTNGCISQAYNVGSSQFCEIYTSSGNTIEIAIWNGATAYYAKGALATYTLSSWNHVCAIFKQGTTQTSTYYFNGVLVGSTPSYTATFFGGPFYIGNASQNGLPYAFLDEVILENIAWTASDVLYYYNKWSNFRK